MALTFICNYLVQSSNFMICYNTVKTMLKDISGIVQMLKVKITV